MEPKKKSARTRRVYVIVANIDDGREIELRKSINRSEMFRLADDLKKVDWYPGHSYTLSVAERREPY